MEHDDKPRLVRVTEPELVDLLVEPDSLGTPVVYPTNGEYYVDAAELAKWRAGRVNEV